MKSIAPKIWTSGLSKTSMIKRERLLRTFSLRSYINLQVKLELFRRTQHVYTLDVQIHVQNDRNLDFVLQHLIFEFAAVHRKRRETRKMLKTKDFYVSTRCIPITHSTCLDCLSPLLSLFNNPLFLIPSHSRQPDFTLIHKHLPRDFVHIILSLTTIKSGMLWS